MSFELYTVLGCYLLDEHRDIIIVDYGLQWYSISTVMRKGPTHPPELLVEYKDM